MLSHTSQFWYALPLVVSISLVYASTRHEDMPSIISHAAKWVTGIAALMAGLGIFLWWLGRGL
jgi:hypothetical protein